MKLTQEGSQIIEDLARRHALSVDAVITLLEAVSRGGGTMAQFNHPELGGSGQWMQGGMTMVGDMFNTALKFKVDSLCSELAGLPAQSLFAPAESNNAPAMGAPGSASLSVSAFGGQWWPADLGAPSSTGSQNHVRYAIFPGTGRLAIEIDGQMTIYDTLNHQIGGIGQQQGPDATLNFTSQFGLVRVADLPVVPSQDQATAPMLPEPSMAKEANPEEQDVFTKIERLAELWQKGMLTEQEFASKKSELMGRL